MHDGVTRMNKNNVLLGIEMLRIGGNLDASSAASNDDYCLGQFDLLLQLLHELHSSKLVGCVHSRRQALVDTRTCSDDEDVVGNVLAAILQVHSLLRHARHAISDPSQYTLRVVSYESPVRDEGLVFMALDHAQSW